MDRAVVLTLNALAANIQGVGTVALLVAQYGIFLYGGLVLMLWWRGPDSQRRALLLAVLAAVIALAINTVLNQVVARPRPYLVMPVHVLATPAPRDPSFPSDHAAVTAALATAILLAGRGAEGGAGLVGALLIGTARVVIGLHYPTDVIGGMVAGGCSAVALTRLEGRLRPLLNAAITVARRFRLA